jgi:hypothetical protein
MNTIFPFGFPYATIFYLVLYLLTLTIHVLFMNYVLAGSAYVAFQVIKNRRNLSKLEENQIVVLLKDWLPFVLSAAITAGVAPLLFIQILYKQNFYTANLLLFHRWMSMVPTLIIGFYLLYLSKSKKCKSSALLSICITFGAFLCFLFAAYSWTENHLISRQTQEVWSNFYTRKAWFYWDKELIPRLTLWVVGAINTTCVLLYWQFFWKERVYSQEFNLEKRKVCNLAMSSLVVVCVIGIIYYRILDVNIQKVLHQASIYPYLLILIFSLLLQFAFWIYQSTKSKISWKILLLASLCLAVSILSVSVIREGIRLESIHIEQFFAQHEEAIKKGGFFAFLFFTLANSLAVFICVFLVKRFQIRNWRLQNSSLKNRES